MNRIPTLDGWRAIAIGLVVICHFAECLYQRQADYELSVTRYGAFGVDIFFGLSGLLITKLLLEENRRQGSFHLRAFYIRRAFRILPPYLVLLAGFTIAGMWRSGWEVASCLLFFRNYVPDSLSGGGTQHLWSLSVEEHFYLLWPGLLVVLGARKAGNWAGRLALLVGLWRLVESQLPAPLFPDAFARFRTDLRLDALLWGCAVAFLLDNADLREKCRKQTRFLAWVSMALVVVVSIRYFTPLTSLLLAALIPMLMAGTLLHPQWLLSRFLDLAPLAWLGRISYSLYLWQGFFLVPAWEHPSAWWRQAPMNLVLSFAAATASYYLVERPMIRLGRRLLSRRFAPETPAASTPRLPAEHPVGDNA
ncbi:MAG TPA: acyltransferase [Bryobacteraceae bacterium]|nr:acyltransferase [Bryobacteraceae bacterium]